MGFGGMVLTEETEVLGENPIRVSLCSLQTHHGVSSVRTLALILRGLNCGNS